MVFILVVVIGLVAWALHLMQEAVDTKEFSLMLAGFLVSSAAAALVAVYLLMNHCMSYMTEMSHRSQFYQPTYEFSYYIETILPSLPQP
ncbi:MAG: hypothetical protein VKK04_04145 [Synechococcales bacterium]|nr:hypothetical protein [Synechococcales bacterium]